jgi:hypothetical protein
LPPSSPTAPRRRSGPRRRRAVLTAAAINGGLDFGYEAAQPKSRNRARTWIGLLPEPARPVRQPVAPRLQPDAGEPTRSPRDMAGPGRAARPPLAPFELLIARAVDLTTTLRWRTPPGHRAAQRVRVSRSASIRDNHAPPHPQPTRRAIPGRAGRAVWASAGRPDPAPPEPAVKAGQVPSRRPPSGRPSTPLHPRPWPQGRSCSTATRSPERPKTRQCPVIGDGEGHSV